MSGEQKSVRARYILVAAMINVTIAGVWNIYVAESMSNQLLRPLVKTRHTRFKGAIILNRITSNKQLSLMRWRERQHTTQIQKNQHLNVKGDPSQYE